ncbi:hypothetical protein BDW62DRAFT_181411 [Aspergillus aurantiobrunneus]
MGCTVDWWEYGDRVEEGTTVVEDALGRVIHPGDNGGGQSWWFLPRMLLRRLGIGIGCLELFSFYNLILKQTLLVLLLGLRSNRIQNSITIPYHTRIARMERLDLSVGEYQAISQLLVTTFDGLGSVAQSLSLWALRIFTNRAQSYRATAYGSRSERKASVQVPGFGSVIPPVLMMDAMSLSSEDCCIPRWL